MNYYEVYTPLAAVIVRAKSPQDALAWANEKLEEEQYPPAELRNVVKLDDQGVIAFFELNPARA